MNSFKNKVNIKANFQRNSKGQALVEYVLLVTMLIVMVFNIAKSMNSSIKKTAGSLGYVLSNHLSTGVCAKDCVSPGANNY